MILFIHVYTPAFRRFKVEVQRIWLENLRPAQLSGCAAGFKGRRGPLCFGCCAKRRGAALHGGSWVVAQQQLFVVVANIKISCRNLQKLTGFSPDFANFWKFCGFLEIIYDFPQFRQNSAKIATKNHRFETISATFWQNLQKLPKFCEFSQKICIFWI